MFNQDSRVMMTILMVVAAVATQFLFRQIRGRLKEFIQKEHPFGPLLHGGVDWTFLIFSMGIWFWAAFGVLATIPQTQFLSNRMLDFFLQTVSFLRRFFLSSIVPGLTKITVIDLFNVVVGLILIALLARASRRLLLNHILNKTPMDLSMRHAVATFIQYLVVTLGLLLLIQMTAGVDLSTLGVLAAAVGVGVGFGLQDIAHNLISGVFILFERPIKVGDRIEVGEVTGDVVRIAARGTTVRTNDNIDIIMPNSSFTSSNVINWSHGDNKVRFRLPVPVAYGSDVRLIERILLEVADENENVLSEPSPRVIFRVFGESMLEFELRVWTSRMLHRRGVLFSQLNFAIFEKFREHHVQIPFPQRDLHLKTISQNWSPLLKDRVTRGENSDPTK